MHQRMGIARRARPGWTNPYAPILAVLRAIAGALLFMGCLLEIMVGIPILYILLNGRLP